MGGRNSKTREVKLIFETWCRAGLIFLAAVNGFLVQKREYLHFSLFEWFVFHFVPLSNHFTSNAISFVGDAIGLVLFVSRKHTERVDGADMCRAQWPR
jgi:hypothetical protein